MLDGTTEHDRAKRSVIMIVCNGEPFVWPQLEHVYDLVDEIVIVEGPDKTFERIINSDRSNDGTIDTIIKFIEERDYENKIKVIHTNTNKNIMVREGNKLCTGELLYHIDVDEFIKADVINEAFAAMENGAEGVRIPQRWYYKWIDTYLACARPYAVQWSPLRFYRNKIDQGLAAGHIPQDQYIDINTNKVYKIGKTVTLDFSKYAYHYLAIFRQQLSNKMRYYSLRGDGISTEGVNARIGEFDKITRGHIGKPVATYHGCKLELETNLFPIELCNGNLRLIKVEKSDS